VGDRIGLTDAQQSQIQAIVDARQPELDALHDQAAAARDAFRDSHEIGDWNETEFRAHFESQARLHVEMQLIGAEVTAQAWNVLTPDQQQQVRDILELFGPGHGVGKRHAGGRRGPQ
ncbi:MAG: Spy/CpxP family protein refolding chaperone, partial [Holophagae bacterium]